MGVTMVKLFTDIDELLTLKGVAKKSGRKINEKDLSIIKKASILTSGGEIIWVGKSNQLTKSVFKKLDVKQKIIKKVSLKNSVVMPGFIECHTHSVFAGNRQNEFEMRNQGKSYQQIANAGGGIISTVKHTRNASAEDLLKSLKKRVKTFKTQGVTALEVKTGYGLDLKTETKVLRILKKINSLKIIPTYLGPHAVPKEYKSATEYMAYIISTVLPKLFAENLFSRADIFIEKGYFNEKLAQKYFKELKNYNVDLTAHIDQLTCSGIVGDLCIDKSIKSLDHLVQVGSRGIKALSKSHITSVLLPTADFYLKMSYPPARKLIDSGARVAIATDYNPGSSPSQDLSFVGVLSRLEMKMTLPEVISAYTVGAAHALGLEKSMGSIEVGKQANFISLEDSHDQLFYNVGYHPVRKTIYKGI